MADETSPPTGQAPAAGMGQDPSTPASGQAPETTANAADAQAALQAARREAAAYRTKLQALERAQADADAAKLTEHERTARERDTLRAELDAERADRRAAINRYEVQLAASKLGIVDPEAATKLLDWDSLEYAEDGSPKHVERALKELLAKKPYLAGQPGPAPAAGATNPASGHATPGLALADIAKLTPAQINARWTEVQAALRRGH